MEKKLCASVPRSRQRQVVKETGSFRGKFGYSLRWRWKRVGPMWSIILFNRAILLISRQQESATRASFTICETSGRRNEGNYGGCEGVLHRPVAGGSRRPWWPGQGLRCTSLPRVVSVLIGSRSTNRSGEYFPLGQHGHHFSPESMTEIKRELQGVVV